MRNLFKLFLCALFAGTVAAQVPTPQVPLTGTAGSAGNFPFLNSGAFAMPSDANYTVTYPNTTCIVCKVTSSVSLAATRNLVEPGPGSPVANMTFNITNATTGGQSIQVIASSGTGITIANGTSKWVWFDGTNYVEIDPPSSGSGLNQLTGDVTAGPGTGSQVATLATVNSNVGTCGDSTHVAQVTLNGKGLATACTAVAISASGIPTSPTNALVKINGTNGAASSITDNGTIVTSAETGNFDAGTTAANGLSVSFGGSTVLGYWAKNAANGVTVAIEDPNASLGAGEYILLENQDVSTGLEIGHRSAGGAGGGTGRNSPNANFIMSLLNSDIYIGPESSGGHTYIQGSSAGPILLSASQTGQTASGVDLPAMTTAGILAATVTTGEIAYATATQVNTLIKTLTGCNTATFVYTPQAADCVSPSAGSSGITGGVANYIPLFGSATTITGPSHLDDGVTTAATITSTEPFAIASGGPSQFAFTFTSTPSIGSSTTAVYAVDSSGHAEASEAAGAFSRICTAANGVCTSGTGISGATTGQALIAGSATTATSSKAVPTGAILGTTDTQAASNKTITASTIDSTPIGGTTPSTVAATTVSATSLNAGGLVKSSASFGVLSTAVVGDVIALWTGTCSSSTFLRGDGACAAPAGSGNTTSTSLTTGVVPRANGANSIIDSAFTDNGTVGGFARAGGFNPTHLWSGDINTCPDTSGSGTAQVCNTVGSFTPTGTPASCVVYTTTTTNSGTGLTVNINSLSAKSVAIAGASGWTTTLTAGIVPANTPSWMCYDGTNWDLMQTGTAASGGGTPAYPLTITGGVSGGVVYGSSSTQLTVSPAGTANVLMKWGGAATAPQNSTVTDNGTAVTSTATGGYVAPVFVANGTTAGFVDYPQGTTSVAVAPCNTATSICEQAPTAVTSYLVIKPGAAGQGVQTNTVSSTTITQGYSGDTGHSATVTTGSGTSIGSTSLCSTALCPVGTYRVNVYTDITTACGTTGTYIVNLIYTDDQGSKTIPVNINGTGAVPATGILTTTSTANFGENAQIIRSTGAASINYSTTATACGTAGPMVGKLYLSVEPVQ